MNNEKADECSIFYKRNDKKRRVTCGKCASEWCVDCYINIFKTNKGIIKCPFCKFMYGQEFPEYMVELGVQQILDSL
jgi:transcription elongation factor Elf1